MFHTILRFLWNVRNQLVHEPKLSMSIFSEYAKAPQNDARSKERRYYAKKSPGLENIDGVLNVEGDEIWISAYWLMSEKGLSTGIHDGSQRGRPTRMRLLVRQTIFMKVSDA
jgi:hypothetical protein